LIICLGERGSPPQNNFRFCGLNEKLWAVWIQHHIDKQ
jgi:hypothetical protein